MNHQMNTLSVLFVVVHLLQLSSAGICTKTTDGEPCTRSIPPICRQYTSYVCCSGWTGESCNVRIGVETTTTTSTTTTTTTTAPTTEIATDATSESDISMLEQELKTKTGNSKGKKSTSSLPLISLVGVAVLAITIAVVALYWYRISHRDEDSKAAEQGKPVEHPRVDGQLDKTPDSTSIYSILSAEAAAKASENLYMSLNKPDENMYSNIDD